MVAAARQSDRNVVNYILQFSNEKTVETIQGPPEINGRFFYDDSMRGLNFIRRREHISNSLRYLLELAGVTKPPSIYIESTSVAKYLPGLEKDNSLDIVEGRAEPRIWVGNRISVQTHFDLRENLACVVSGRRRFTLFPPTQTPNLYPGPFELTLSGPPVSMVRLDEPDLDTYPKFRTALEHATVAELEPGDALYIPYFWWHHVQALDDLNVLVNYWWNDTSSELGSPYNAMLHGILALRDMSDRQRRAWKIMFETYVFGEHGDPVAHLMPEIRGPLGQHDQQTRQQIRMMLISALGQEAGIRLPKKN